MLDVHPPQHAAHTWRDFFIHIATIVVGLLIAIGLEQTVEFIHHRHEVKETREALRLEHERNLAIFSEQVAALHISMASERNNLLVLTYLKQHPGTPEEKLPGVLWWGGSIVAFVDAQWQDAKRTNITALMPQSEVRDDAMLYAIQDKVNASVEAGLKLNAQARQYVFTDPNPAHLTPAQIEQELDLIRQQLSECDQRSITLVQLQTFFPEAKLKLSGADFTSYVRTPEETKSLAAANALTKARIDPAYEEMKGAEN